ncbi:MAG: VOC family protein, partial [Trueperaceae bacterium]|nr:VOC family protein [Trueperaceae bacterium]
MTPFASATPAGRPLDHVGIALESFVAADVYGALGWRAVAADQDLADQGVRVRLLRGGPGPALELLVPLGEAGPIARFLARRGPGLHHLAYAVADLDAEMARLAALGAPFVDARPRPGYGGHRVAFHRQQDDVDRHAAREQPVGLGQQS